MAPGWSCATDPSIDTRTTRTPITINGFVNPYLFTAFDLPARLG